MECARAEAIRSGDNFVLDAQVRTLRGEGRWMRLSIGVERDACGRAVRLFGAKQDITGDHAALERLRHLAERDPLTGLANRGAFDDRYRAILADRLHHASVAALVLIDVDRFKQINDQFGHAAGDECLRYVALRLRRAFDGAALVARIGGDEFAVLLSAPLAGARAAGLLRHASRLLCRPIIWNGARIDIAVSIGARMLAHPFLKPSDLFAEADIALYAAKVAHRGVNIFGDTGGEPCGAPAPDVCAASA